MVSNTRLTLNLQYPNVAQVAYAMQGDRLSRAVVADLIDGSTPWTPPAGAYGLITASKPDGTFAVYDTLEDGNPAIVIDGSTVTLYLAEQVLADAGAVKMSVAFFTAAGARLTTFRWTEVVAPEAVLDRVVSENYISILTATMAEAAEIFQQIKAAYGAPLTANTAAAMTDTSRVYVYTGTTGGGFTNGHWYYWDGTAWTDGGVYNSAALETDKTLSIEGMAADAKVTGDALGDITSVGDYVDLTSVSMTNGSYIKPDGTIGSNGSFILSDFIELPPGVDSVTVNRYVYSQEGTSYPQSQMVFWYDENKAFKSTGVNTYSGNLLTSKPASWFNYKYIRVNFSRFMTHNFVKLHYFYDLKYKTHLLTADLNDITDPGIYLIPSTTNIASKPDMQQNTLAFLTVNLSPFNGHESQVLATRYGQYTRTKIDGVWSAWSHSDFGSAATRLENTSITDIDNLQPNKIYLLSDNVASLAHLPFDGFLGTLITYSGIGATASGNTQAAISSQNRLFVRTAWGESANWSDWVEIANTDIDKTITGELYSFTGTFTTKEEIGTDFVLEANTSYIIKFYGNRSDIINVYGANNTNNYKNVPPWTDETVFTNDGTSRYLCFYNPNGQLDTIDVKVFALDAIALKSESVPRVYRVTKSNKTGDYTSLSRCLLDLKNDNNPKIIEVWEGDYDIYAEYVELYQAGLLEIYTGANPSMDYFNYCVWVPKNTHIIGKGLVRLKWMPDPEADSITPVQCRCISPLNVAATATIENVEVHCKNGRYCLHNDGLGKAEFTGAVQKYIGVKFFKYANDIDSVSGLSYGFNHTIGFGIDRAMHHIYDDCVFNNETNTESYHDGRAFYGHSRGLVGSVTLTEAMCSDITVKNCMLNSNCGSTGIVCKLGNSPNQNLHIPVIFNNCYLGEGWMQLSNEGSASSPNAFDLTFNNCGTVKVNIPDTSNKYPPKAYRTTMTLTT